MNAKPTLAEALTEKMKTRVARLLIKEGQAMVAKGKMTPKEATDWALSFNY